MARARSLLAGKKVLIVEDNYLIAEELRHLVQRAQGLVARTVSSAAQALQALADEQFDGVLLDVQLQDGSSIEVAKTLEQRGIPFVVVTGYGRDWLDPPLRTAPYLAKPYRASRLMALAARHFRG